MLLFVRVIPGLVDGLVDGLFGGLFGWLCDTVLGWLFDVLAGRLLMEWFADSSDWLLAGLLFLAVDGDSPFGFLPIVVFRDPDGRSEREALNIEIDLHNPT